MSVVGVRRDGPGAGAFRRCGGTRASTAAREVSVAPPRRRADAAVVHALPSASTTAWPTRATRSSIWAAMAARTGWRDLCPDHVGEREPRRTPPPRSEWTNRSRSGTGPNEPALRSSFGASFSARVAKATCCPSADSDWSTEHQSVLSRRRDGHHDRRPGGTVADEDVLLAINAVRSRRLRGRLPRPGLVAEREVRAGGLEGDVARVRGDVRPGHAPLNRPGVGWRLPGLAA